METEAKIRLLMSQALSDRGDGDGPLRDLAAGWRARQVKYFDAGIVENEADFEFNGAEILFVDDDALLARQRRRSLFGRRGLEKDQKRESLRRLNLKPRRYVAVSGGPAAMKTAIVTGISGQDGAYLAQLRLLQTPWLLPEVIVGITEASTTRRCSTPSTRSCGSVTVPGPVPMAQVPQG